MPKVHFSRSQPKVLFIINSLAGGGAERVMMALLTASQSRFEVSPFSLALLDDEPDAYAPPGWLPVHRLATGGSLLSGLMKVRALVNRDRPDLIVSFLTRANIIAAAVGRLEAVPTVISERVNTSAHLAGRKNLATRLLVRATYPITERVIAVSQGVADDLVSNFRVSRARTTAVPNPVDVAAIQERGAQSSPLPTDAPFVVAVGRLTATKNMSLLIQAYADSEIKAHLVILGEGPERDRLTAEAERLGVADRVILAGFVPNPFAVVRQARAYVSASNGEGFPNSLVEAMALGLPVIATNCASGPSEILAGRSREDISDVIDTPYGRLVPTNDRTALAEALRWVDKQSETALTEIGVRGQVRVRDFGLDVAVTRYWDLFDAARLSYSRGRSS